MKTKFNAVMHVTVNQPKEIAELATRVGTDMDENDDVYTAPSPPLADLATENGKLLTLNGQAKGNSLKKAERDAQAIKVFGMLSKELVYVNEVADGDLVKVEKSGFDSEKAPEAHDIPPTPVIRKMIDGKVAHSAQILLAGPLTKRARYSVQIVNLDSDGPIPPPMPIPGGGDFDPDSLDWSDALQGVNSYELIVLNLKRGKDMAFRVRAEDGSKKGNWSDPFFFMPR